MQKKNGSPYRVEWGSYSTNKSKRSSVLTYGGALPSSPQRKVLSLHYFQGLALKIIIPNKTSVSWLREVMIIWGLKCDPVAVVDGTFTKVLSINKVQYRV